MKSFALSFALSLSLSCYTVLQFVHSNWSYCILTDHWFLMSRRAVCVCEYVCVFCTLYVVWWGVVIPMTFTSIICTALVGLDESVLFLTLTFIWLEISLFFYLHKKLIVLNAIIEWGNKIESICVSIPKQRWIMSLINSMAMTAIRMKNLHDLFMPTCATGVINSIQFNQLFRSIPGFWALFLFSSLCVLFLYSTFFQVWTTWMDLSAKCANNKCYDTEGFLRNFLA